MLIINKIEQLISQLNSLKPELSDDSSSNEKKFTKLLKSNIEANYAATDKASENEPPPSKKAVNEIPSWVDQEYDYNPKEPRKPNMREMMEAISGKSVEELYATTEKNWQKISSQASEILYGVAGSNTDTRNWNYIMESENVLQSAQEQTGAMYAPSVDILSNFDENNILTNQIAVIKDKEGNTLRSLPNNLSLAEETLRNFGATRASIPENLENKINPNVFNKNLLTFLKSFDNKPSTIDNIIIQSASDVIANKLSQEIPVGELDKL